MVNKAEDTKLKRSVALKFLCSDALEDKEHKARSYGKMLLLVSACNKTLIGRLLV